MKRIEWHVARKYLWAQRRSLSSGLIALFSAAGVTIGTWLLIFVLSAINGFEHEVKKQLMGKDAHLEVTLYHFDPMQEYDSVLRIVSDFPAVTAASPFIMTKTIISKGSNQDGIVVMGIDPERSRRVIELEESLQRGRYHLDSLEADNGKRYPGIILGYALAARLEANPGDRVFLADFSSGGGITMGTVTPRIAVFTLAGTFESGMYQFDENLAYIHLDAAQRLFGMKGSATGIQARVRNPEKSDVVAQALEGELGYPYRTVDWKMKNYTLIKWMGYEKVLVGLALGIIIIIAAFNIISSLVMAVNDKKREIGILRAMGSTRGTILRIFVLEGSLIGLIGSSLGLILGLVSYEAQRRFGFITLPGDVYFVTTLPVRLQWYDVLAVMVGTNLLCALATILPSLQAARQDPLEAIRHE